MALKLLTKKMVALYSVAAIITIVPVTNYVLQELELEFEYTDITFVVIGLIISSVMTGMGLIFTAA